LAFHLRTWQLHAFNFSSQSFGIIFDSCFFLAFPPNALANPVGPTFKIHPDSGHCLPSSYHLILSELLTTS
jgi:hypothetical protein